MSDPINPKHYKRHDIECIDAIKAALVEGFPDYLRGNVLKYLWRYKERNGVEDLRKARQYLDWLVEESEVIAEASGASETPSETQIPQGWRELKHDEVPSVGDKFLVGDALYTLFSNWTVAYGCGRSDHVYIRKIETPSDEPKEQSQRPEDFIAEFFDAVSTTLGPAPPKRYREPTQADLRDGPIKCDYRDNDHEQWRSGLLTHVLSGSMPFLCKDKEEQLSGQWEQCRIEEA